MVWDFWSLRPESLHQVRTVFFFMLLNASPGVALLIRPCSMFLLLQLSYWNWLLAFWGASSDFLIAKFTVAQCLYGWKYYQLIFRRLGIKSSLRWGHALGSGKCAKVFAIKIKFEQHVPLVSRFTLAFCHRILWYYWFMLCHALQVLSFFL